MFLKMENQFYLVKPFLVLINALPKKIYNVGKYDVIDTDDYPLDKNIEYNINMEALHKIKTPLIELNNMIGMYQLKENIVDQIIYFKMS